ncbi:ER quality-control lectin, putative [Candida dubliniensis CD36]|uniref:Endoplasmic reticulum lectin n=1 Tax=Candida dubliniensis (strain CD36 / ATCC MYA-646 / CBS 7987 / NCPF 3949 / NRRL Y-17841) TaxID=573826 RepID=B9WN06_CANDC|nr:ER quality-control lectin, putative [Candida dubliniensis CD36]CAX40473.1 ER quality-control lectin, putative [Candida dubliniensis CD36]
MNWISFAYLCFIVKSISGDLISQPLKNKVVFIDTTIANEIARSYLGSDSGNSTQDDYEILSIENGVNEGNITSYLCQLPRSKELKLPNHTPTMSTHELKSRAIDLISESFGEDNSCLYSFNLHANYWTIGYCHGANVIQFHENLDDFISGVHKPHSPDHVYTLGKFSHQTSPSEFEFDSHERTISQRLLGEICDLTGEPRTIDTVYRCDHKLEIAELTEIRTCQYELHINVPKLCSLQEFRRTNLEEGVLEILCTKIE